MNTSNRIATASIAIAIAYNKDPDAEFIAIDHSDMDAIVEYFKDHAVYKYCTDLTMDGQLKFRGKPVIAYIGQSVDSKTTKGSMTAEDIGQSVDSKTTKGSMTAEDIKRALNKVYGAGMFHKEASDV